MSRWAHAFSGLAIAVTCVLAYSNNLQGKLVLDDRAILVGNEHIRSLKQIPELFRLNWWGMTPVKGADTVYRPLSAASYSLDVFLMGGYSADRESHDSESGGLDLRYLHASSIGYHVLASLFVYWMLLTLLGRSERALWAALGALLFAAHPVHVEAVSGHVGRAEVLNGLFFFAATAVFLHGTRDRDRLGWSAGAAVLWLGAMLSKEMAATLPVGLILVDWYRGRKRTLREWVVLYSPFVAAGVVYGLLRYGALGVGGRSGLYEALPSSEVSYGARLLTMTHAFAWYWLLLVAPVRVSADYSGFPITRSLGDPTFLVSAAVVGITLAAGVVGLRLRRRERCQWLGLTGLGILSVYYLLFPVSNLAVNTGVVVSERALYIPSIGVVIAVAAALQQAGAWARKSWGKWIPVGVAGLAAALGVWGCRDHNRMWLNERTLFTATVAHPYCGHIGFAGMSRVFLIAGDNESALRWANRSVAAHTNAITLDRQAQSLFRLGRYQEAIKPLEILVDNKVGGSTSLRRLGKCYMAVGRTADARALLARHPELASFSEFESLRNPPNPIGVRKEP